MRAIILVLALSGCGLTMTRGPGQFTRADGSPRCTTNMAAPERDGIAAAIGLLAIVFGAVAYSADNDAVGAPLLGGGIVTMGIAYASGGVGYYRVKKCRKAIDDFERAHPAPLPAPTPAPAPLTPSA